MMIHDTNSKDSTKIKMKLEKENLSTALSLDSNKMTEVLTPQVSNDSYLCERVEENTNTKNKGVWYNARTRCWLTCVKGTGRHLRVFSVKKYGYKQAKMLALECKSSMCANEEDLLKKQELKDETEVDCGNGRTSGNTNGPLNGNLQENDMVSNKWESVNGKNEKCVKSSSNETWRTKNYGNFYLNTDGNDSINNKTTANTNINSGNPNSSSTNDNSSDNARQMGKVCYTNSLGEKSVSHANNLYNSGNGIHNGKSNSSGYSNSNNGTNNYSAKKGTKRGNRSGNKNTYLCETKKSNAENFEFVDQAKSTNDVNIDSKNKNICDQVNKNRENDWRNRRYNTRRGNQVLANDKKGIKRNNLGNSNYKGNNQLEGTACNINKNGDTAKNISNHATNFHIVKRRKRTVTRCGKNYMPSISEGENEKTENEKKVELEKENNAMKNCLITAEDFQLDSSESTDSEKIYFNPFPTDLSEKGNEKKKKKNKQEEEEVNYIFTGGYYSDSNCKSKRMKDIYKNIAMQNHSNGILNTYDEGDNLKMNEGDFNCCAHTYALNDYQMCSPNTPFDHVDDVRHLNKNLNISNQVCNHNKNRNEEEHNQRSVIKESSRKKISNYKNNFLDLTREALIVILQDLKTNVIPRIATENEKRERYANVLRLSLRNAKYTKHFNELEPYLDLFGECIRNSKLPSNMAVQDQLSYLEKL